MDTLHIKTVNSLSHISHADWDALLPGNYPFFKHAFLLLLEQHNCLENTGWYPQYFLAKDNSGKLLAAAPAYIKTNSFGEFVFDQAWADAYERAGLEYFPKLILAAPFTPATGPRILIAPQRTDQSNIHSQFAKAIQDYAEQQQLSSVHCLFPAETDKNLLSQYGWLPRIGYQYHWNNQGHHSFEDFLSLFRAHRRKTVRQERASIRQQHIQIEIRQGDTLTSQEWIIAHDLYRTTFEKKGNYPALTANFFQALGKTLGPQLIVIFARCHQNIVAAVINLRSDTTLYGRYWGCYEEIKNLHFELCFYQGIEYCIQNKIEYFEPGAQGEHKISRGFLPTPTWSCHWIKNPPFRSAIAQFLQREAQFMQSYRLQLNKLSPFHTTHADTKIP